MEFPDWVQVKVKNTIVSPETVEQLCLIASLIAHVHRQVHFLSESSSGSCNQVQNKHTNYEFI